MDVFKNAENLWKKYIVASLLAFGSFGLFLPISNIYLLKQAKDENQEFINVYNLYFALKKGGLLILVDILVCILLFTNLTFIYSLNYPLFLMGIILILNYIFLFEVIIINLFYPMFVMDNKFIESLKKACIIGNLNIGLTILVMFGSLVILTCIVLSPLMGLVLFPVLIKGLHVIYFKLEDKYFKAALNTI